MLEATLDNIFIGQSKMMVNLPKFDKSNIIAAKRGRERRVSQV